jgi:hypothetical protein
LAAPLPVPNQWNACATVIALSEPSLKGSASQPPRLRTPGTAARRNAHPINRFDREHVRPIRRNQAGELPGSGCDIGDGTAALDRQRIASHATAPGG